MPNCFTKVKKTWYDNSGGKDHERVIIHSIAAAVDLYPYPYLSQKQRTDHSPAQLLL